MGTTSSNVPVARWETTGLWQALSQKQDKDAGEVRATIKICMKTIVQILDKAATSPQDFTLHDADHSFRVAERMVEIIPSAVLPELSTYELGLLLLSAYAHDIGMTPERARITLHYEFLLTNESSLLTETERVDFQQWLDYQNISPSSKAGTGSPTVAQLRQARELITYYCRAQHNAWSMAWIRSNLSQLPMGNYVNWVDDLAQLCGSHHEGHKQLTNARFDERIIASHVVHMRYLACVLRVADVLDIDPERTPQVILRHRSISNGSILYWYKDAELTLSLQGDEIIAYARPSNAYLHKAINDALDGIDQELETTFLLSIEHPFSRLMRSQGRTLPHEWVLPRKLTRNVAPRDGNYDYIDGAFRPDTSKLLELLSGVELYESKWSAIRELLQNAFDAVRVQLAWQRLNHSNPLDPTFIENLRQIHTVRLELQTVEEDGQQNFWLTCSDTGIGMTKSIIENYLLVSGARRQPQILELTRRCKAAGFELDATGQFGIGVLSYFMIADKLEIQTIRSREAGDTSMESTGWYFESEGVGSFGELRRDDTTTKGTIVRLRLRSEFSGMDLLSISRQVSEYLNEVLVSIPCNFKYDIKAFPNLTLSYNPGWVRSDTALQPWFLTGLENDVEDQIAPDLVSKAKLEKVAAKKNYWKNIRKKAEASLRIATTELEMPGGLGKVRAHFPLFSLPLGMSLVFFDYNSSGGKDLKSIESRTGFIPEPIVLMSWKGMAIQEGEVEDFEDSDTFLKEIFEDEPVPVCIEIDWASREAGEISVNRHVFVPSAGARNVAAWLHAQITLLWQAKLLEHQSDFSFLNHRVLGYQPGQNVPCYWIHNSRGDLRFGPVTFPAMNTLSSTSYDLRKAAFIKQPRETVSMLPSVGQKYAFHGGLTFNSRRHVSDRVVYVPTLAEKMVPVWTAQPKESSGGLLLSNFPINWKQLCGFNLDYYRDYGSYSRSAIWNRQNPFVNSIGVDVWNWVLTHREELQNPPAFKKELLADPARVAGWIFHVMSEPSIELWEAIQEKHGDFMRDVWEALSCLVPVDFQKQFVFSHNHILVLNPSGWRTLYWGTVELNEILPDPGDEWTLILDDEYVRSDMQQSRMPNK